MNKKEFSILIIFIILFLVLFFTELIPAICLPNMLCVDLNENGYTSWYEQLQSWYLNK